VTLLSTISIGVFFILAGFVLVLGSQRRWSWLVDPPEELWPFYSQALLKKLIGTDGVVWFTYVVGLMIIVITVVNTTAIVWRTVNG
jgi:hypothetical protein